MALLLYRGSPECAHHHDAEGNAWVVQSEDLTIQFPDAAEPALHRLSCSFAPATHSALIGPNGAGKSTFLKAAAGLLPAQSGSLTVFDCPAIHCHPSTCYLPQRSNIDWEFPITVEQMILTGSYIHLGWLKRPGRKEKEQVQQAVERLHLTDLTQRRLCQLSGGQQQRVLLARALVHDAQLYLLDEPFTGLDSATMEILSEVIGELRAEGRTLITSIHTWEHLPIEFDQMIYLQDGRIQPPPESTDTFSP